MSHKISPQIRTIPFDLSQCLSRFNSTKSFLNELSRRPGGISTELWRLGLSVMIEFGEAQVTFIERNCADEFKRSDELKTFIKQEFNHSGYHHKLNKFLEPRYKRLSHGQMKCNYLNYPFAAKRELQHNEILNPSSLTARDLAIKNLIFTNTVFEASIGIYDAIAFFRTFEDHVDEMIAHCPFMTYLWLYHYTEEIEHVHVALERFEERFQSSVFSAENYPNLERAMEAASEIPVSIGIEIGLRNDIFFDFKQFHSSPYFQRVLEARSQFKIGFDLKSISDLRAHYIEMYDKKWEPFVLKKVQQFLNRDAGSVAA